MTYILWIKNIQLLVESGTAVRAAAGAGVQSELRAEQRLQSNTTTHYRLNLVHNSTELNGFP